MADKNLVNIIVTKLMLDALKPREVDLVELALALCSLDHVGAVDIVVTEVDAKTETVKITVQGEGVDMDKVIEEISKYSTVVRSIDAVTVMKKPGH